MAKFVMKHRQNLPRLMRSYEPVQQVPDSEEKNEEVTPAAVEETKEITEEKTMTTSEKVELAKQVLGDAPKVKRIKKDKGLIERAESTKSILMEDNRELLID